ncbi:COG1470 family protein [Streptomyces corynorhini]|uniref:Hydrolase n=1 Tax=Streptomyces corynorhini TaxID=2282652 RepID=A0A370B5G6_9ACTN|nr:hydrolase [Streptomyces corynorhini]RDG37058.1 hydrolase [Streptomyces corynorhini]
MSLWTSLEPASTTVDPGDTTTVRLRIRNTGDVVDEYRFVPVGDVAPYITIEPSSIRLFPGTTGTLHLTFSPPRTPDAIAGPHPYGVQVVPTEQSGATTVVEGNVSFTPFTEVRTELVPPTVKGWFRGRPKLAIDNLGNTRLTASLAGSDNGDSLSYELFPASVQIEPGRAAFVDARLKPRRIIWFGPKQERPYALGLQRSGTARLDTEGTYVQRGLLPLWLATVLSGVLALAIALTVLWFAYQPSVRTLAQEQPQSVAAHAIPTTEPSKPPTLPTAEAPAAAPSAPVPESPAEEKDGGKPGGGEEKEEPAETVENTAAVAVTKLNERTPGRHICYRAYVRGTGWQDPVCDGLTSGTEGQDRPLESINIAVSGTNGMAANGYIENTDWEPKWKGAENLKDVYIGTPDQEAFMRGLAISVGEGSVCVTARVHTQEWQQKACSDPGGYKFGGTLIKDLSLEAFKLIV